MHALLVQRADTLVHYSEESIGSCELSAITDTLKAYVAKRWRQWRS